jgi:hypothetical protein
VQNNSGPVTISASGTGHANSVSGNVNVSGHAGGDPVTNSGITGNCQLSGDKSGITHVQRQHDRQGRKQCNTTSPGAWA